MKILVVQDFLRSGGTERQSVLLARGFASAGHPTTLLTFRPGGALALAAPEPNLTCLSLQRRDTRLDWWAPGIIRRAREHAPDVVLCMGRMANCYGHSLQEALPDSAVISTLRTGKPLPRLFRRSLHRTRHIVANSRAARNQIVTRESIATDRISVIHNALVFPESTASAGDRDLTRDRFGATPASVVMLDVAMFRPEKNQIALIEIASQLPSDVPWQLWLAGEGPALATCRDRAAALGLTARIHFPGWQADPTPLYLAADLAVHASRRESLSNFLIEAQAHGLPAVAYDALGVSETFIPDQTGLVIPTDDAASFRSALLSLISDPSRRAAMSAQARAHATENFSTAKQIEKYLELFSTLQNSSPSL